MFQVKSFNVRTFKPHQEIMFFSNPQGIQQKTRIDPKHIADAQIGNVLQPGAGAVAARTSQFIGGLPCSSSAMAINRQCSSGLQVILQVFPVILRTGNLTVETGPV